MGNEPEKYVERQSLDRYGIDSIEWNTCEDTFENRQRLRRARVPFQIEEPGVIEVLFFDPDELNAHHDSVYERRKHILSDSRDAWSDYLPQDELPLDFWETAPAWIIRHKQKYDDAINRGEKPSKMPLELSRCRRMRADGTRCWHWAWPAKQAEGFCRGHSKFGAWQSSKQRQTLIDAARGRITQLTGPALDTLEDLVLNSQVPAVRLRAAETILDRTGIRGGTEIDVSGNVEHSLKDPAEAIRERLRSIAENNQPRELESSSQTEDTNTEIIEGEIVEQERDTL